MKSPQQQFIIALLAFSSVCFGLVFVVGRFFLDEYHNTFTKFNWIFALVFTVVTAITGTSTIRASEKRPQALIRSIMSGTVIRLFTYLILFVALILNFKDEKIGIIICFFSYYALFLVFEKIVLSRFLHKTGRNLPPEN